MLRSLDYLDQVLDEKYRLESLLGEGGMGAVYLATHLGTGRYVALKLITPQFMGNQEFIERFKREAKAAGRLRHPNVVDVTDFGFAEAGGGTVAYLVMEYLDGCTLGDVLSEEKRLPLEWVVDILEQVCSAVHEAHQQGIVHRDLKPDNIWLEPNRLGGYRVKVLDFGIAKLGEATVSEATAGQADDASSLSSTAGARRSEGQLTGRFPSGQTHHASASEAATMVPGGGKTQIAEGANPTQIHGDQESDTLIFSARNSAVSPAASHQIADNQPARSHPSNANDDEAGTQILPPPATPVAATSAHAKPNEIEEDDRTLMLNQATRTAVKGSPTTSGSAMGGTTELTRVGAIMGTPQYMSPEQCVGKSLDSRSDLYSLGVITYQMLAGEPPFTGDTTKIMRDHRESAPPPLRERRKVPKRVANLVMTALAKDPADRPQTALAFANSLRAQADGVGTLYRRAFALYSEHFPKFLKMSLLAHSPVIVTTVLMIVLQLALVAQPKPMNATKIALIVCLGVVGLLHVVAYFLAASAISGMTVVLVTQLQAAPLRPVELETAVNVLKKRWKPFLKTSIGVTVRIFLGFLLFVIPGIVMHLRYTFYAPVVLVEGLQGKAARQRSRELASRSWRTVIIVWLLQLLIPTVFSFLIGQLNIGTRPTGAPTRGLHVREIYQQVSSLVNIVIIPLVSIVSALLYLKMRQLGGETLSAALGQIEQVETKRSKWQERMRTRLSLPTPRSQ